MAFKMKGWGAFTKKTDEPKADMPEVKVTPDMEEKRDSENKSKFDKFGWMVSPAAWAVKKGKKYYDKNIRGTTREVTIRDKDGNIIKTKKRQR
jgi:hypothetical protein